MKSLLYATLVKRVVGDCGTIRINSVQWVLLPLKLLFCTQWSALWSITVNLKQIWFVEVVIEQQKEWASVQSACYQFVTEWFQDSNYIQSVYNNRAINCDKSVKIAIPLPVTYTDIHIKQKFTVTGYICKSKLPSTYVILLSNHHPAAICGFLFQVHEVLIGLWMSVESAGSQLSRVSCCKKTCKSQWQSVTLHHVSFPESVPIKLLNRSDWD